jgi:nitrous oxide reductase accessory protein NosL
MPLVRITSLLTILLMSAACTSRPSGPPEIVVDRTACSHCTMLISEPRYAAAYQAPGEEARVFDDIACLLEAAREEAVSDLRFWFHDGNDGQWIDGQTAVFVASSEFRTPMGGGIIAYRDRATAETAAGTYRGEVIGPLPALFNHTGGQS